MKYCALASGSNGNCYYIAKDDVAILIDVGINSKHVHLRMHRLGIDPTYVKAIFITHEHTDHICGLAVLAKKYNLPVYITQGSYEGSRLNLPPHLVHFIKPNARVKIGGLEVIGIPKYHDAREPCSFAVYDGKEIIGVLTDIGRPCDNVKHVIKHSDVLLLESNYDEDLLENGRYPYFLKNRIRNGWGHISNRTALDLLLQNRSPKLKHVILGHLSGENNRVELVEQTFAPHCKDIRLSIATRCAETPLFDTADNSATAIEVVSIRIEQETTILYQELGAE